jgi:hypothetical protein
MNELKSIAGEHHRAARQDLFRARKRLLVGERGLSVNFCQGRFLKTVYD